jgi:DNA-binding transcriptional LysR family regulator
MDLRQLRTFVHVAQLGSISLAAERLHIAQSALTRQIQSLEAELDVRLLRRHGRGVALTAEGEVLQERAVLILREVEATRQAIKSDPQLLKGEVSFGMPPSVADVLSGQLIETFSRLHPHVRLRAVTGASGYVLEWLQRGVIDLGVIYDVKTTPMIRTSPLMVEQLYLIERAAEGAQAAREIALKDALAARLVLPSRHHGLRLLLEGVAAANGLAFDPVVEADSMQVQLDLVRRGLGATILPYLSVVREIEAGTVAARLIVSPHVTRRMVIARAIDRPIDAAAEHFLQTIAEEAAGLFHSVPGLLPPEEPV